MNYKLYYSECTEREGSWQRPDGFVMSNDKDKLQNKIDGLLKYAGELSWEYHEIKSIEVNQDRYEFFLSGSKEGIYFGDNYEWEKFR